MLRNQVVIRAQQAIMDGRGALFNSLPTTIGRILREAIWKTVTDRDGQHFPSFKAFCEYPIYWGLETPFDKMVEFCRGNEVTLKLLVESDSPAAQKAKRDETIVALREAGMTQAEIGEEVGLTQRGVGKALEQKSQSCEKSSTQQVRAKVNGVSHYTQRKIDRIRKVDPYLADQCELREVKVDAALRQVGLVQDPVEKLKALIARLTAEQRATLTAWLVSQ